MPKWTAPDADCPGVSVNGDWFAAVAGVVTLPDEPEFAADLSAFGFKPTPDEPSPAPSPSPARPAAPARASRRK